MSAVGIAWLLWSLRHWSKSAFLLLIPIAVFIALAVVQERLIRSLRAWSRIIRFYERGLERLSNTWMGSGETGERFLDASHPYSRDLDLFGRGSLFELLCTARTRAGEGVLARWLLSPAAPEEVLRRQSSIQELKDRIDFREKLSVLGEEFRLGVNAEYLAAWGEIPPVLHSKFLRIVAPFLAAAWLYGAGVWFYSATVRDVWGNVSLVVAASVVNLAISYRYRAAMSESAHAIENAGRDLELLSGVMSAFEREPFDSPKLVELQAALKRQGTVPSAAIARLNRLLEYLVSGHNLFVRAFDPVVFWTLQFALAVESWRESFGPAIRPWIEAVGEMEALLALSAYTYEHPEDVFPEFVDQAPYLEAEGLAHPLIPAAEAVRNDFALGRPLQLIMLSGPNMAGKSTLLRGIGANVVLAQSGAPVRAKRLRLSPLAVAASICVLDSLPDGISRFYAEIRRLKQIVDLTEGPLPVLFLMDELLSGTNSHDRLIGTRSVVEKLIERGAIGWVTTHDLALAEIPNSVGSRAVNYHFADHLEGGELKFDYKLRPGVVQTSNALHLMRSIGLEV